MCHSWCTGIYSSPYYASNKSAKLLVKGAIFFLQLWVIQDRFWKPFLAFQDKISAMGTSSFFDHCHIAYILYKLSMFFFFPELQRGIIKSGYLPKLVSCLISQEFLCHCYPGDARQAENDTFSFSPKRTVEAQLLHSPSLT